jgi:uncharacterized protein with ParB-like and HNH nuclease domain
MQIYQIIDKINDNQMFVPAFQREYVWKRADAKALFSSLIKKYPTGTLLTWETTQPPELKGQKKYSPAMGAVKLVLDGQQRITTIYMMLTGNLPPYYTQEDIKTNVTGLYVNLQTLELEYFKRQMMEKNPLWVDLTNIFNGQVKSSDIRKALKSQGTLDDETENLIDENFEAIKAVKDRDFPEQIIPVSASIKEAIDIFYVVNASGVNLTDAELALAQICGYWSEARELFKSKLFELEKAGFVFKLDFIIYALLAVTHDMGSEMKRLHGSDNEESIKLAWEKLDKKVLDYVVNLLKTNAYVDHSDEINSPFALIPIISFVFKKPDHKLSEDEIKRVIKWFYYSQLRQRYISQTPQKLDKDLGVIKNKTTPFAELLSLIEQERKLEITQDEFVGRDIRHPLFSLMRWYLKSRNAVCLGTVISLRQNMGAKYALEKDHIFPYAALKTNGYDINNRSKYALAQELTNRAILTQLENRSKSDTAAKDYLARVAVNYPTALELQCIPTEPALWEMDRFEEFLAARRALLTEKLNSFLDEITEVATGEGMVDILDTIAEGEHDALEFKSSLRWDTEFHSTNKILEEVVLKTISAFNNSWGDGGKLIIGVDDDQNVLGLEGDYSTLNDGSDKDAFEIHLRNLINQQWNVEYAASNLTVSFE